MHRSDAGLANASKHICPKEAMGAYPITVDHSLPCSATAPLKFTPISQIEKKVWTDSPSLAFSFRNETFVQTSSFP